MMSSRSTTNQKSPLILGTISILLTIIGLLIWAVTLMQLPAAPPNVDQVAGDEREPTVIIVEEQPAVTDLKFLLPLLLTSFGAVTSFGALVIEWRQNKREIQEDALLLRIQRLDLELKTLQIQKLRQEMDEPPTAEV